MEKNNTKCFESIYDLFSQLFGDVQCTESCKCKCHNHDTEEKEKKTTDDIVLTFTDEDFKDEEKLNQYVDYLEDLRESFDSNDNSIFSLAKVFGFDYNHVIDELIEHAENVYDESREEMMCEEEDLVESEVDEKHPYTTQELAESYVKDVLAPTFNGLVSERTQKSLIDSYKKFADWIIEQ